MDTSARGLRVLITAGASGIGYAFARTFSEAGARVHICDIDEAALARTKVALPSVTQTLADVARVDHVDRLFAEAHPHLGGLDVMVNNAGIAGPTGNIEDIANVALFLATDAGKHISGQAIPVCGNIETLA